MYKTPKDTLKKNIYRWQSSIRKCAPHYISLRDYNHHNEISLYTIKEVKIQNSDDMECWRTCKARGIHLWIFFPLIFRDSWREEGSGKKERNIINALQKNPKQNHSDWLPFPCALTRLGIEPAMQESNQRSFHVQTDALTI